MTARVMYAYSTHAYSNSDAPLTMMHWRCSCGGRGTDVPGAQLSCPSCGETIRVPDQPMGWESSEPEPAAEDTPVPPLLDPRFDLRELAYRILVSPDLYLFGHKGGGVGLHCRTCPGENTPLAYHGAKDGERRNLEIAFASSVSGLWAQAAIHLAIHHGQETP